MLGYSFTVLLITHDSTKLFVTNALINVKEHKYINVTAVQVILTAEWHNSHSYIIWINVNDKWLELNVLKLDKISSRLIK
jgi:hypothetical protein